MIAWDVWALRNNKDYQIVHSNVVIYDVSENEWASFSREVCPDTAGTKRDVTRITYSKEFAVVGIDF